MLQLLDSAPELELALAQARIIRLAEVRARVNIVPVSAKTSDDQPDYRVYAGRFELGAGWSKTSDRGNDYVSLVLDDPSFAGPLYAALMPADEPDTHRLVWSRPKRNDN